MGGSGQEELGNPAPLGLMGFGMTTVLLNLHNSGIYPLGSMVLAMGLAYGGLAQIIAGILEYRRGITFGTVAFTSYGLFWWSFVFLLILPKLILDLAPPSPSATCAYLLMWGFFTTGMFAGTLRINVALQTVFASLFVLFYMLAAAAITGNPTLETVAGYEGIFCGFSAMYTSFAGVLNEYYGREVLPVGQVE